jgi:lambda family phage portal protein
VELAQGLPILRARHRDLVRNQPYAGNAVNELTTNTIGTGILAKIKGPDKKREEKFRGLWMEWAETTACDSDGLHDFYGLQVMAARCMFESGEVLIRRRWRKLSDGLPVPLQLQVLEPDHLDTSKNEVTPDGPTVQGVAFDLLGRRRGYWIFPEHPGALSIYSTFKPSVFVPASEIIHLYFVERVGQVRGIPRGASAIIRLRDFDEAQDAYMNMQKIAACLSVFIVEGPNDASVGDNDEDGGEDDEDIPTDLMPAGVNKLRNGQDIKVVTPPSVAGYKDFSEITLQGISRAYQVPVVLLTGDYSDLSYSGGRIVWRAFGRNLDLYQWITIIPRMNRPTFSWFLQAAELAGEKTAGVTSGWVPPRREIVDPDKEYKALGYAVRMGFMSLFEAIRQLGYEPEEVLAEAKKSQEMIDKLGLVLDSDPRHVTQFGMNQPQYGQQGDGNAEG